MFEEYKDLYELTRKTVDEHIEFYKKKKLESYEYIKKEYLTLFSILDYCTFPVDWGISHRWYESDQFESDKSFRKYVDRWYLYIDKQNLDEIIKGTYEEDQNDIPYYDEEFFREEMKGHRKKARDTLQRNGYEIPPK